MLYIVGTPIGNLEDLSYRQAKTLSQVDIILSEDTRSTKYVLEKIQELFKFSINPEQNVISYYKEKEFEKLPEIIDLLKNDKHIALISQAGMPGISDPGYLLINTLIKQDIPFIVIPGPSAVTTALLYSGFKLDNFCFLGFLPKKESEIKKIFNKLLLLQHEFPEMVYVFFESPNRLSKTLQVVSETLPEASISIARELTKYYEEVTRGSVEKLLKKVYKGEITIVLKL